MNNCRWQHVKSQFWIIRNLWKISVLALLRICCICRRIWPIRLTSTQTDKHTDTHTRHKNTMNVCSMQMHEAQRDTDKIQILQCEKFCLKTFCKTRVWVLLTYESCIQNFQLLWWSLWLYLRRKGEKNEKRRNVYSTAILDSPLR